MSHELDEPPEASDNNGVELLERFRATSWALDTTGSAVRFTHKSLWGLARVRGEFTEMAGDGEVGADGSARGRLAVSVESLDTRKRRRDERLRSVAFLNSTTYPSIIFDVISIASSGDHEVVVSGDLEVAGVSRALELPARVMETPAETITLLADLTVERADFGLRRNWMGMFRGPTMVSVIARLARRRATT